MQPVDLAQQLLAEACVDLAREAATGTLLLERGNVRKSLAFLDGAVVGAESSLDRENLSARLAEAGELSAEDARRVEDAVSDRGCTEAAALVGLKLIDAKRLLDAMRERIVACALEAFSWQSGTVTFDTERAPGADARRLRCDTLELVHRGASLHSPSERLAAPLIEAGTFYATLPEGRDARLRSWIGDDAVALRVLRNLDGSHSFENAVGAAYQEPRALAALWIAQRTGELEFADAARGEDDSAEAAAEAEPETPDIEIEIVDVAPAAAPATAATTAKAPAGASAAPSPEAEEIRKAIGTLHENLGESTYYEMLGLKDDAKPAAIKKAYFKAAKRFHPDKLGRLGLDDIRAAAVEVFAALSEANEVLSEPKRRKEYDQRLASGGSADDVDVARLAQAEGYFRKSEVLVKMGDFRGAAELLETTVQLWPEESEYHAALGFARFKKSPSDVEGAQASLQVAIDLRPENAQAHMWLSLVLRAAGDVNGSAKYSKRARELDPTIT